MKKIKGMFKEHDLFKIVLLAVAVTFLLTWIIPAGGFNGGEYTAAGINRTGLVDAILSSVYSANFFLQQLLFILFLGLFYGIISKTSGYKMMVSNMAKKFVGKEKIFVLLASLFVTLLTTFTSQTFVVLIFVPLIISICKALKLDKISGFLCTFGSMFVGILGATFGTEGLNYFISYLSNYGEVTIKTELGIRFGILALSFIVYSFFSFKHVTKVLAKKVNEDKISDSFDVEDKKLKKAKVWPMATFFIITLIFVILGYVDWSGNFNIEIFNKFHEWLVGLQVGDYNVISYILGKNATAFGSWELYSIVVPMSIILIIAKFIYNIKFDEIIENAGNGIKSLFRPVVLLIFAYMVFVLVYWSPFTVTITHWILGISEKFNPFLTSTAAAIASLFHTDFGYTGYVIGDVLATTYADSFNVAFLIYTTINGLVQIVAPTSITLLIGLAYLDIPYKKWLKYIWRFVLIMLVILLIIFSLLAYI